MEAMLAIHVGFWDYVTFGAMAVFSRVPWSSGECRLHLVVRAVTALIFCFVFCFAAGVIEPARAAEPAANVDAARLDAADKDPANWMTYGRTYSEQRFSPLAQITADNVNLLGLAWYADFDIDRGQEATPLIIDGVMYVSTAWSMVRAFDAKTGRPLWSYDPKVPRPLGVRGAATWSVEAWPRGRERFSSPRSTAGWWRSMPAPASRSGVS